MQRRTMHVRGMIYWPRLAVTTTRNDSNSIVDITQSVRKNVFYELYDVSSTWGDEVGARFSLLPARLQSTQDYSHIYAAV